MDKALILVFLSTKHPVLVENIAFSHRLLHETPRFGGEHDIFTRFIHETGDFVDKDLHKHYSF